MRNEIKKAPRLAALFAAMMVAAFGLAAWSFDQAHRSGCQARDTTLNVMAAVLRDARDQSGGNQRAVRFYDTELDRINAVRC